MCLDDMPCGSAFAATANINDNEVLRRIAVDFSVLCLISAHRPTRVRVLLAARFSGVNQWTVFEQMRANGTFAKIAHKMHACMHQFTVALTHILKLQSLERCHSLTFARTQPIPSRLKSERQGEHERE